MASAVSSGVIMVQPAVLSDETTYLFHRSFTQPLKLVESSKGHVLTMGDGHKILDACGGAAVACIGQGNEEVIAAAMEQMRKITYTHPLSYTTRAAEDLAQAFLGGNTFGLQKMFLVGSGSEANDIAMKLARHYFVEKGQPERVNFVARKQAFHGNTIGALSLGSHVARRRPYLPITLESRVSHVSPAYAYQYQKPDETEAGFVARLAKELEDEFLRLGPQTVVAFVVETVGGATSGCVTAPEGYFVAVREICDKYGILLILDEVMSGAGRTGTMFAFEQEGIVPDIMTLGKGLGGGYTPVAAIIAHKRVCDGFRAGPSQAFNHGQTYQAHPLSAAIATAVQRVVRRDSLVDRCACMGRLLGGQLKETFADAEYVGDIRGRGLFWALEFVRDRKTKEPLAPSLNFAYKVNAESFRRGVSLYPGSGTVDGVVGDHLMFAPAYTITEEEIARIVRTAREGYDHMAGPAGLLLSVLLARNGLSQILCVEPRLEVIAAGHADGLHSRSLEMFKLLGLYEELMKASTEVGERARWAQGSEKSESLGQPRMERVMRQKISLAPNARMKQLISIPQGRIERILEEDLMKHANHALQRSFRVVDVRIDETSASYPVLVTICEDAGVQTRQIQCKFLVGADGAHSTVRRCMGVEMEGDSTEHVWGVVDFVTDTDFPDIRRLTTVQNSAGMAMVIPRETNGQGQWLTRFYVDMNDLELKRQHADAETSTIFIKNQQKKSRITVEDILQRLAEIFAPFRMIIKKGTEVDWSTAYAVGQRVASAFIQVDASNIPRIFLVGDACHTHSPKLGQGMNVSMADSFNLAWKLTHALNGSAASTKNLLQSYASERRLIAQQLIELDRRWYSIQWAESERKKQPGYQDECVRLYQDISGFTSGCGIQYEESLLVVVQAGEAVIHGTDENDEGLTPNSGMVKPGRRLPNTTALRIADGCLWDLHDNLLPDGAGFKIFVFCGRDLLDRHSHSAQTLQVVFDQVIPAFPRAFLDAFVVAPETVYTHGGSSKHVSPLAEYDLWPLIPACIKREAEMRTYALAQTGYDIYGIDIERGAVVVVRPDGIVGTALALDLRINAGLMSYLQGILA
ncbi:aminotransferase class 3 [Grosmannia clavigera kw1407]|uniref:Aminotransferase class 3 n=1 Tax=Grosmannia clavigera (strain kw1407 / UAMH 11150) TaxID=655863 RepID=F0XRL0_GROCL|nr:aminotransferase class 3 [Grosmannia clavigera kw1407]EFW99677.1 aminotransferase class 3 [Grosmannia clavigera kw1407]